LNSVTATYLRIGFEALSNGNSVVYDDQGTFNFYGKTYKGIILTKAGTYIINLLALYDTALITTTAQTSLLASQGSTSYYWQVLGLIPGKSGRIYVMTFNTAAAITKTGIFTAFI
jgi:hypothetical protein